LALEILFKDISYKRVAKLGAMMDEQGLDTCTEIDGGVTDQNIEHLVKAIADDLFVTGSHVFKSDGQIQTIKNLKH
jgi:ribulose-phosphate 3-epimerase